MRVHPRGHGFKLKWPLSVVSKERGEAVFEEFHSQV